MSYPEHITDHVDRALARVLQQYRGRPKIEGQIEAHADQSQSVEDALWGLGTGRLLEDAEGVVLDRFGQILNEARGALTDELYALSLGAKIRLLRSSGTVPDIIDVFETLRPALEFHLVQWFPAGFILTVETPTTLAESALLASFLRRARIAGVRGQMVFFLDDVDTVFTFSDDGSSHTDADRGFADDAQTTGGHLAGVTE
jgi:hypothetical protein